MRYVKSAIYDSEKETNMLVIITRVNKLSL